MLAEDAIKSAISNYYTKNPKAKVTDLGGTGEPGECDCGGRDDRSEHGGPEPATEQHRHRRLGKCVGRHRPERDGAELQPENRSSHDATG